MATIEIDDEDNDELKAALEALKDPSRPLTDAQWRALGPMMTLEASDNETRRLQQEARKTLADITKREDTAFTEKLRRINQDTVDRDTKARKFAAEQKLSDDFHARQSEAYAPKRPPKEPPRRPLTDQLKTMEALRPGFDIEDAKKALAAPPASQDKPGSTGEGTKALGANQPGVPVEDAVEPPEPPLGEMYPQEDNEQRVRNLDTLGEGAEHRAFAGSDADLSKEDYQVKRRAKIRQDYVERYGRPPTSFRETPEGDILPVLSKDDYESTMNWLELDERASKAKRARDLAGGKDPVGERAMKLQDDRQAEQARLQEDRQSGYTQEAMRRESVKQGETTRKEEAAFDADSADALSFAGSPDASPEERAFADYMQSTREGAPGGGLPEQGLKSALAGVKKLRNRVSGLGHSDMLGGRSFSDSARRNVGKFLSQAEADLSNSFKQVSGQAQALKFAQAPGAGLPEPEQLPTDPAFSPITDVGGARGPNTQLLQGMGTQMMGDIPGYAGTGGVSVSDADPMAALGMGVKRLAMLQSPMGPTLQPSQSRLLPKNQAAASQLQQALQHKGPVQRATSSLMFGLGTDAQRNKLMDYLVTYGGFDPNQFALRTSLQSDPQWNDIVSQQVIEGIRRTRMGQGPAK